MAKGENQKLKMLYLAQLFFRETDENHGLTMPELIRRLHALGVNADRKTLYQDIALLRRFGMDILCSRVGNETLYQLVSREFELPELKLLVDSVQSSRFLTEKKSEALIGKLEQLVSRYDAGQLSRQVHIAGRIKSMNESIYYTVDTLQSAIDQQRQIHFQYFQWNAKKQQECRHGGKIYDVGPWQLWLNNENYYLIGYDAATETLRHYRVDKMKNIEITEEPRYGSPETFEADQAAYTRRLFGMYSGEPMRVLLRSNDEMLGPLIDRFGTDIPITPCAGGYHVTVEAAVSPQFYAWVAGLGSGVQIISPRSAVKGMTEFARTLFRQYSQLGG